MLPFRLVKTDAQVAGATRVTTTNESCEGLVRVDGDALVFQFVITRTVTRVGGTSVLTDRSTEPVREVRVPIASLGAIRYRRFGWFRRQREIIVTARDLRAFVELPAARAQDLTIPVIRDDEPAAVELVGIVELAMADHALKLAESGGLPELNAGS